MPTTADSDHKLCGFQSFTKHLQKMGDNSESKNSQ